MAQRVETFYIDDIDGSPAEREFTFAVDGVDYAIDLSSENIAEFKLAVGGFVESARKVSKLAAPARARRQGGTAPARADREQIRAVREWARNNGYSVSDRGRLPAEVQAAFDRAHTGQQLAAVG